MLRQCSWTEPHPTVPLAEAVDIPPVDSGEWPWRRRSSIRRRPLYINDEGLATDEIVFGPVVQVVTSDSGETARLCAVAAAAPEPIAAAVGVGYQRFNHGGTLPISALRSRSVLVAGAILLLILNSPMARAHGPGPGCGLSGVLRGAQRGGRFAQSAARAAAGGDGRPLADDPDRAANDVDRAATRGTGASRRAKLCGTSRWDND